MGAMPESGLTNDAMPRHRVDMAAFEMSAILITQGLWRHLMGNNPSTNVGSKNLFIISVGGKPFDSAMRFSETLGLGTSLFHTKWCCRMEQKCQWFSLAH